MVISSDHIDEVLTSLESPQKLGLETTSVEHGDQLSQHPKEITISEGIPLPPPRASRREAVTPNSGKKRVRNFPRYSPSLSHHDQISAISQDAGKSLGLPITPRSSTSNARRLRIALFATSNTKTRLLGSVECHHGKESLHKVEIRDQRSRLPIAVSPPQNGNRASIDNKCCKNTSSPSRLLLAQMESTIPRPQPAHSDQTSPTAREQLRSAEVVYPDLTTLYACSHSSNTILNTTALGCDVRPSSTSGVETWLMDVPDHERTNAIDASASSDNSVIESATRYSEAPPCRSPHSESSCRAQAGPSQTLILPTRSSRQPNCKIPRLSPARRKVQGKEEEQLFICEDETSTVMVELSPNVQHHRKGYGPKRKRCLSYWDDDILPEWATPPREPPMEAKGQNARQALGELVSLTRSKAFAEEAESAHFDFEVDQ
ncbi:MAG: hypothetical protein L6R41_004036 [Letrouitia leprolyta]|nr:MAG: hypothetical protein L6R41_004036 [Letrouitia leprolyta]